MIIEMQVEYDDDPPESFDGPAIDNEATKSALVPLRLAVLHQRLVAHQPGVSQVGQEDLGAPVLVPCTVVRREPPVLQFRLQEINVQWRQHLGFSFPLHHNINDTGALDIHALGFLPAFHKRIKISDAQKRF